MLTVCKRFTFEAAHFLPEHPSLCKNLHGHRFELEVEVKEKYPDKRFSILIDFKDLKDIVQVNIIDKVDHSVLNEVFPEIVPTAENLVRHFAYLLEGQFFGQPCILHRIRLHETENSFAEWRNE